MKLFSGLTLKLWWDTLTIMLICSTYLLQTVFSSWGIIATPVSGIMWTCRKPGWSCAMRSSCLRYSFNKLAARTKVSLGAWITSSTQPPSRITCWWSWNEEHSGVCNWNQKLQWQPQLSVFFLDNSSKGGCKNQETRVQKQVIQWSCDCERACESCRRSDEDCTAASLRPWT